MIDKNTIIHSLYTSGHREMWASIFKKELNAKCEISQLRRFDVFVNLLKADKLIVPTLDDDYLLYSIIGILRSLFGKVTIGLLVAPQRFFSKKFHLKSIIKRFLFKLNLKFNQFKIFSIVPHKYDLRYKEISNDWIYDPHLWNLWTEGQPQLKSTLLSDNILFQLKGKKLVIYIGNHQKGLKEFVNFINENKGIYIGIICSVLPPEYDELRISKNFIIINRYITNNELLSLYMITDLVWCKYIKSFDQSSGIFGYALQTRKKIILREGSYISILYKDINKIDLENFVFKAYKLTINKIKNALK